jgi:hypothetical protein
MDEGLMATVHPLVPHDAPIVAEMRRVAAAHKGEILGTHARPLFNAMLSATLAPDDVGRERGMVGGVGGWWCRPKHT